MARKRKKAPRTDLAAQDLLLAEEDVAAMRPALAVAPELVVQTLEEARRRSARKRARRKAAARKGAASRARKAAPKKPKAKKAARKK
jgi:hypothetical protein